jgi:glycosyltransferase involved in cell wall biosynthesis
MRKKPAAAITHFSPETYHYGPARENPHRDDLKLTLFVACYNEEQNIEATLDTLLAALTQFPDLTWETLIIDDASTDRSIELIKRWIDAHPGLPVYLRINPENKNLAYNYVEGAFWGRGEYYRLVCGDNVEPVETFVEMIKHLGAADIVIFYQDCTGRSAFRRFLSRSFTHVINLITGHRLQYYNGLAIHRRYNVIRWNGNYHGFGFQADVISRLLDEGFGYTEVRVKANERPQGESKALRSKNIVSVVHTLIDLAIRRVGRWFR